MSPRRHVDMVLGLGPRPMPPFTESSQDVSAFFTEAGRVQANAVLP